MSGEAPEIRVDMMAKLTVWYDGGCPLCLCEIAMMKRWDTRQAIEFVDLLQEDVDCPLDRSLLLQRFHACEDGQLLSGAAAFAAMWRAIPRLRLLGLVARNTVVLKLLEGFYRIFLRLRPRLQRAVMQFEAKRSFQCSFHG